jgi:hypothetical protein
MLVGISIFSQFAALKGCVFEGYVGKIAGKLSASFSQFLS